MMKGPMCSDGGESGLKSGTSTPAQRCCASLHQTCGRSPSQGLPAASQDARLYSTRRLAGHDHPQFGNTPRPEGSSVPRRCIWGPASVQEPQYSQLPDAVDPSSRSQPKPGSCWPALIVCPSFGSVTSASAYPLISRATSLNDGLCGLV